MTFKSFLKNTVSGNILLYYMWFKLVRQRTGLDISFFEQNTNAYLDGYPRSGNTFLIHLSKHLFPELNIVHHLHAVAPIKIAFLKNLPVFILLRNPMDAISSNYLKHIAMRGGTVSKEIDTRSLHEYVSYYQHYYSFVLKHSDRITIIDFQKLIESPKTIMNQIADRMAINKVLNVEDIAEVKKSYRGATDTFGSSRPNEEKEFYKNLVKDEIIKSDKYTKVKKLYEELIGIIE